MRTCLDRGNVAFTMIDQVSGRGETGEAPTQWVPTNLMFLVVLPDEQAARLAEELAKLEVDLRESHGGAVPLKVFSVECEALVG